MRILITGGAGCLGSNLTERYLEAGHDVLVIDNFATGHRGSLPDGHPRLAIVEGSIADRDWSRGRSRTSSRPTSSIRPPPTRIRTIGPRTRAPTSRARSTCSRPPRHAGVTRFVNFHTALGYGRPDRVPIPVDAPCARSPATAYRSRPARTTSPCPACRSYHCGSPTSPARASPSGPSRPSTRASRPASRASARGRSAISSTWMISSPWSISCCADDAPTGIFNVSTGTGHSIKEIFDIVVDHLGVALTEPVPEVDPGADDVPAVVLDPCKTIETFGWSPRYGFEQTIRRMLAWYDHHGVTAIYSHLKTPPLRA